MLKAGSQLHWLRRDDEHLDVGDLISDAARHAAGKHHLLRHLERERINDALGEVLQLLAPLVRQHRSIPDDRRRQNRPTVVRVTSRTLTQASGVA